MVELMIVLLTKTQHDMVRFRMLKINVVQFAILANGPVKNFHVETRTELKHTLDGSAVAVDMTFSFLSHESKIMILQVSCEFGIHPDDLKELTSENKVIIPKNVIDYFIAQTVGTARGILHCKTEGTPFNGIIIPPLNVTGIIDADMVINLSQGNSPNKN